MSKTPDPTDLSFLEAFSGLDSSYRQPDWLKSDFSASIWQCSTLGLPEVIDFNIKLDDDQLLSSPKHANLKDALGSLLTVQLHPDATFRRLLAPGSAAARLSATTRIVDWFLMNSRELQLTTHGLEAVTSADVRQLIRDLSSSNRTSISIYRWGETLQRHLQREIANADQEAIAEIIRSTAEIDDIDRSDSRLLKMTDEEIILARAVLVLQKLFVNDESHSQKRLRPRTSALAKHLYRHTLFGTTFKMPPPPELCFGRKSRVAREHRKVPLRAMAGEISGPAHDYYKRILRTFPLLPRIDVAISPALVNCADEFPYFATQRRISLGRTKSLPIPDALKSLRSSIEFFLKYADPIVESFMQANAIAEDEGIDDIGQLSADLYIHPTLKALGTSAWRIKQSGQNQEHHHSPYFEQLRANRGLRELILVLIGATQVCLGILTARRKSELEALKVGSALHHGGRHIMFANAKSGSLGIRQNIARPIQNTAARMIRQLERLHSSTYPRTGNGRPAALFSIPSIGGRHFQTPRIDACFDIFSDYFETGFDEDGRRYYIRGHQLRRFFAMMFFWSHSFGGLDTLRWFLGHTDPEHVYHYITAALSSSELAAVKAEYAIVRMRDAGSASPLHTFLHERLGATAVNIMSNDELQEYVEMCVEDGLVVVEPEYFRDASGKHYRILILVKSGEQA